jgi:RHS repeat-associated protein
VSDTNSTFRVALGFAGGLFDSETGLVHFAYRDYDPEVGRWTAKDPLLFLGGDTNLYSYVANNPVNSIDAYGLSELFGLNASEWGWFLKETTLEFAGVAGDVAMIAGAATAAITAGSATVAVGGALLAGKALMDLSLKAMNIQDELNGENKSTTGDALTQLARDADPCDEALYDAALLMSTFLNTLVGGGLKTNLDHVDKAVSYGGKMGLFDTVYKHAYDLWYGKKHRL